jgi:hypothetical protein
MGLPKEICPGSLKYDKIQIKLKKSDPQKEKCLGWKEKKLCGLNHYKARKSSNFCMRA